MSRGAPRRDFSAPTNDRNTPRNDFVGALRYCSIENILTAGVAMRLTAIIEREGSGYASLCPELDIASQGETVEQARENLREALDLFFECASADEIKSRLKSELYVTQVEVVIG